MGLVKRNRQILARWSRTKRMFELFAGKILRSDRARCHMLVRFSYYVVKILCELLTSALRTSELDWTAPGRRLRTPYTIVYDRAHTEYAPYYGRIFTEYLAQYYDRNTPCRMRSFMILCDPLLRE